MHHKNHTRTTSKCFEVIFNGFFSLILFSQNRLLLSLFFSSFKENVKNVRKTLKVLQQTADKENLTGRTFIDKDTKLATR